MRRFAACIFCELISMPSVQFTPPHWLYWLLLVVFPIVAFYMTSRTSAARDGRPTLTLAYFIWLVGGYLGLHRLYLKNLWGLVFLALFGVLLWASGAHDDARIVETDARAAASRAEGRIERSEKAIARAESRIERFESDLATREPGSALYRRAERGLERERDKVPEAQEALETARLSLAEAAPVAERASADRRGWAQFYSYVLYAIIALLAVDALLIPRLLANAQRKLEAAPPKQRPEAPPAPPDSRFVSQRGFTGWVDRLCLTAGEFVSYWTVLAVFAFCYEVVVRKAFNSPTDWVHESVVYLFAMQYLIAGSYAMLTESHVRVDLFYAKFPPRVKAVVDLVTSLFFFIFVGTLLFTGYIFAADAIGFGNTSLSALARGNITLGQFFSQATLSEFFASNAVNGEVANTTWRLQLWPVKIVLVLGAVLLLLQGVSRVIKDAHMALTGRPHTIVEG